MALQIFVSHSGIRLYADPNSLPSTEALRSWIAENTEIPAARQILMTARGKNVKQQHLLTEGEIFVYDKQYLSSDFDEPTTSAHSSATFPKPQDPPATISSENSLQAWQELFMARRTWALDVAETVRNGVNTVQRYSDEAVVIARSTSVALDNLRNHVGTLQQKFEKTQKWAHDMLEEHKAALNDWQASVDMLKELPVRKDVVNLLQPDGESRHTVSNSTLHELVETQKLQRGAVDLEETSEIFGTSLQELEESIKELLTDTARAQKFGGPVVGGFGDTSGLFEESETLAKRISTDYEEVLRFQDNGKSISLASRRALVHTQEFLPTLQSIVEETKQGLASAFEHRNSLSENCLKVLRDISVIESGLGALQAQITALDVEPRGNNGLEAINKIFQLPIAYGSTLIEAIRRAEWANQVKSEMDTLTEDVSQQRDDEQRRRKRWMKTMEDFMHDASQNSNPILSVDITIPDSEWPLVVRDEIFSYVDDLRALGIDDAVRQVTQMLRELDAPVKSRKRPNAFKNGSVRELEQSMISNGDGANMRSLQDDKLRLEEKLRSSDSRVRKLEDLLHRSSQMNRPTSGTFGVAPGTEKQSLSPSGFHLGRPEELLSRRSSVSSRRLSNQTDEEKVLVKRIVSLEAEVMRLQREAHAERRSSTESRDKMQEAESIKRDLMANFEAQRQEFEDERQLLEDETHKLKIRLEEIEDELDRLGDSRQHLKLTSEDNISGLQAEIDRLRQASDSIREDGTRQRERAATLERHVQQLKDERSTIQAQNMDLANQLRDADRDREEHFIILQDVHANLSPGGSAPEQFSRLIKAIEVLSEGLAIHARGMEEQIQLSSAEKKELEEKVGQAESRVALLERQLSDQESSSASVRESLSRESGKLASVRAELIDEREELKNLRTKFAAGETGSEALRERLIDEEKKTAGHSERLATSTANAQHLQQELDGLKERLQTMIEKEQVFISRLESRGVRAKELSQRLFHHNDRMIRMLEQLGYSVTRLDDQLIVQRASKANASTILAGAGTVEASTLMKRTVSGSSPTQHYQDTSDLDTLYWLSDSDAATEAAKYYLFTSALGRLDLDSTVDMITKRYKDVETMAKKYQKDSRAYREKSHRLQSEAHDKIAYRAFKEGDLALFLPTRNQATRPWAAFNVGAPHYFLREQDAHKLPNRDWLLARISKVEERVVDLSRSLHNSNTLRGQPGDRHSINTELSDGASMRSVDDENPFELSDGLRWYMIDAAEEKPGAPSTPGLGKSTVAASNVEVKGSIRLTKEGKKKDHAAAGNPSTATKTLSKSLDSRRSSSGSKKGHASSPSLTTTPTLATTRERQDQDAVRPADADLQSQEVREDARVFDVDGSNESPQRQPPSARSSPAKGLAVSGTGGRAESPAKRAVSPVKPGGRPWDKLWSMEYHMEGK